MKHPSRKSRIAPAVMALVAAIMAMGVLAASSQADARFTYEMCDPAIPGGNPLIYHFVTNNVPYSAVDSCASPGGWFGIEQTGPLIENFSYLETSVPPTPEGWVESVTMTGFADNFHGNGGWVAEQGWPGAGAAESPRVFSGSTEKPPCPIGAEVWAKSYEGHCGDFPFQIILTCGTAGYTCEGGATIGARYLAAVEVDPTPPKVKGIEGPLVAGGVLRGHQELKAQATDVGGGLTSLELKVDGTTVPGSARGTCTLTNVKNASFIGVVADSTSPCPASLSDAWNVDTSAAPFQNGANTIQVCASDFATIGSPNTTCSAPQTVEVNNACTESPVAGGADLSAGFGKDGSDELTVKYGKGAQVKGGLTDQAGDPITGATICLESQSSESSAIPQTVETATTDSKGDFELEVKPGANRQLLVGYRHDSFQVAKKLSMGTRVRPTLKVDTHTIRGGRRLEITGKLPQPAPAGRVLVLQGASAHGHDWLTFRKVTTGPKGGFKASYRFTRTNSPTTYRIRALAPRQAGYDYEPGASRPARIKVRP